MINPQIITNKVDDFIETCRIDTSCRFLSKNDGEETLYASSFAVMLKHYIGKLASISFEEKKTWSEYLNSWQDQRTGLFVGPEIKIGDLTSKKHDWDHVTMHLTAHVLPSLDLLGSNTKYPLFFAQKFLDKDELEQWLNERDWRDAWLEGNNLIFILQFLVHLRDKEGVSQAQESLNYLFEWLDKEVDPSTGLWGTNGYCSSFVAMCGGYHQLLAYYHEEKTVKHPKRLVDTVISLQHPDGGFSPCGGGGACEDVDAVDILVNTYKLMNYKRPNIRHALRKSLNSIYEKQMSDGGFVYRFDEPFIHMGVKRTASKPNQSNMFATWFRIHTLALISEILTDESISHFNWKFNSVLSMGWHRPWDKSANRLSLIDRIAERRVFISLENSIPLRILGKLAYKGRAILNCMLIRMADVLKDVGFVLLNRLSIATRTDIFMEFIHSLVRQESPKEALKFLLELDNRLYILEGQASVLYGNGLHTKHKHINYHQFFIKNLLVDEKVLDIGSGNGFLAYDMATSVEGVKVTGIELNESNVKYAREHYKSEKLELIHGDALLDLPDEVYDVITLSNVLEHIEDRVEFLREVLKKIQPKRLIIRIPMFERDWRVPLKEELGMDYRLDSTHFIEYRQEDFFQELDKAGLNPTHVEFRWGEIWCVAEPEGDGKLDG